MAKKDEVIVKDRFRNYGEYSNSLSYCVNLKPRIRNSAAIFHDACVSHDVGIDGETDFFTILTKVHKCIGKCCKRKWVVYGSSPNIPSKYTLEVSKKVLIGVGRVPHPENKGDLHFYVVTQINGDGQSIDAMSNSIQACQLHFNKDKHHYELIQYVGRHSDHPVHYEFLGFFTTGLLPSETSIEKAQYYPAYQMS
ncbi:hypothetical protein [Marinomonas sp. THO17]|uniref:hypothetical protein n=1 Tax=Marinomonas sp. THO17 TaxID=3149048 RepID=UPI00336BF94E